MDGIERAEPSKGLNLKYINALLRSFDI